MTEKRINAQNKYENRKYTSKIETEKRENKVDGIVCISSVTVKMTHKLDWLVVLSSLLTEICDK